MSVKKEVTIYDIARALDISASTVSRGLREHPSVRKDTRKKILKVAREMGYQHNTFASSLRKKRTNTIGVVLPRLDSYFMSTVIAGMEKVAKQTGYNLIISQSEETFKKEVSCVATMFNSRVDGLLVSLASDTENLNHLNILFNKGIPVVFFDRVMDHPGCISIVIDNFKAGYDITSHLIRQDCKRIVHIGGCLKRNVYKERFNGYKKALEKNKISCNENLVFIGEMDERAGTEVVNRIISGDIKADGIFASNDTTAVACICRLKQSGIRVPEDISVAGFNNDPISRVIDPNLTTINYPGQEMGEVAASTLINKLNDISSTHLNSIVLKHELIQRSSSKKMESIPKAVRIGS